MVRRVLNWINSFSPKKNTDDSWKDREIGRLRFELEAMRKSRRTVIPIIEVGINDPEPVDQEQRERYVSEFNRFFEELLGRKLKHLIAQVREDLDWSGWKDTEHAGGLPEGMTRGEYDAYLRGTSNAFRLLLEYGEQMKAEHTVNITSKEK